MPLSVLSLGVAMRILQLVSVKLRAPEGVVDLTKSIINDGVFQSVKIPMPAQGQGVLELRYVTPKKAL